MGREFFDPERLYDNDDNELDVIASRTKRAKWRHEGIGPAYHRFGRRVKYDGSDLNAWAQSVRVATADHP